MLKIYFLLSSYNTVKSFDVTISRAIIMYLAVYAIPLLDVPLVLVWCVIHADVYSVMMM